MPDCYDTSSFPQSLIDTIIALWDTPESDGQPVVSIEYHMDTEEALAAVTPRE